MRAIPALAALLVACSALTTPAQDARPGEISGSRVTPAARIPFAPTPTPFACSRSFCYPRLHIDVELVDAFAAQEGGYNVVRYLDPGTVTYDSAIVIAGHSNITPMGGITGWEIGDDVQVDGRHFTVFAAVTVFACVSTSRPPLADLYMVTSVNAESCASGRHQNIVVMARGS